MVPSISIYYTTFQSLNLANGKRSNAFLHAYTQYKRRDWFTRWHQFRRSYHRQFESLITF